MSGWTWRFTETGRSDFADLQPADRNRIAEKLEEICTSPWREPPDYGEPLQNSPYK